MTFSALWWYLGYQAMRDKEGYPTKYAFLCDGNFYADWLAD